MGWHPKNLRDTVGEIERLVNRVSIALVQLPHGTHYNMCGLEMVWCTENPPDLLCTQESDMAYYYRM